MELDVETTCLVCVKAILIFLEIMDRYKIWTIETYMAFNIKLALTMFEALLYNHGGINHIYIKGTTLEHNSSNNIVIPP
jgi:hypothetical protein